MTNVKNFTQATEAIWSPLPPGLGLGAPSKQKFWPCPFKDEIPGLKRSCES